MHKSRDVIIVGGGVIGCSIAFHLAKKGIKPLVLERGRLGAEASDAASGIAYGHPGDQAFDRLTRDSYQMFPSEVEELKDLGGVDAELTRCGKLDVALEESDERDLLEAMRLHDELGIAAEWLDRNRARELAPELSESVLGGLHVPEVSSMNNHRLSDAYAAAGARLGAEFRQGAQVAGLILSGSNVAGVRLLDGEVHAAQVVIAAGAWSKAVADSVGVNVPVRPVRGQNVSLRPVAGGLRVNVIRGKANLVPRNDGSLLVGVTLEEAGFDSRVTAEGVRSILERAIALVPSLADAQLDWTVAGLRPASFDGLPLIGPVSGLEGLSIATGHYRSGIALSPITGSLIADLLTGAGSECLVDFSPDRFQAPPHPR